MYRCNGGEPVGGLHASLSGGPPHTRAYGSVTGRPNQLWDQPAPRSGDDRGRHASRPASMATYIAPVCDAQGSSICIVMFKQTAMVIARGKIRVRFLTKDGWR